MSPVEYAGGQSTINSMAKVPDFLRDLEGSQAVFRCDFFMVVGTPAHRIKSGCVNFPGHASQIGYRSNVP